MSALIIASHLPGEGYLHSKRFEVRPVLCADEWDYWRGLAAEWDSGRTLINVEHDIEWSDEHIAELVACPHGACSFAYVCHWKSSGIAGGVIAAGAGARDSELQPDAHYLQGGEEWANWSGLGLVKITRQARIGRLRREPWNRLELAVADAVRGPWHMHWPTVQHHHW